MAFKMSDDSRTTLEHKTPESNKSTSSFYTTFESAGKRCWARFWSYSFHKTPDPDKSAPHKQARARGAPSSCRRRLPCALYCLARNHGAAIHTVHFLAHLHPFPNDDDRCAVCPVAVVQLPLPSLAVQVISKVTGGGEAMSTAWHAIMVPRSTQSIFSPTFRPSPTTTSDVPSGPVAVVQVLAVTGRTGHRAHVPVRGGRA